MLISLTCTSGCTDAPRQVRARLAHHVLFLRRPVPPLCTLLEPPQWRGSRPDSWGWRGLMAGGGAGAQAGWSAQGLGRAGAGCREPCATRTAVMHHRRPNWAGLGARARVPNSWQSIPSRPRGAQLVGQASRGDEGRVHDRVEEVSQVIPSGQVYGEGAVPR